MLKRDYTREAMAAELESTLMRGAEYFLKMRSHDPEVLNEGKQDLEDGCSDGLRRLAAPKRVSLPTCGANEMENRKEYNGYWDWIYVRGMGDRQ